MSIDKAKQLVVNGVEKRRTYWLEFNTPYNQPYNMIAHREAVLIDEKGNVVFQKQAGAIYRDITPELLAQTVEVPDESGGKKVVSALDVMNGIIAFIDKWDAEDNKL